MVDRTAELEKTRTRVMREHQCDCEVCSRSAALCPASAGTIIDELACHVMATAELRARVAELERERDEARAQSAEFAVGTLDVTSKLSAACDRIEELEAALRPLVEYAERHLGQHSADHRKRTQPMIDAAARALAGDT